MPSAGSGRRRAVSASSPQLIGRRVEDNEGLGLRHRETDQHGTFEPSGDDRNAGQNPSQGRDAGAPGEAAER